jgi:prepilin-type N-terminal cleavage/methylation domain-containing protein
MSSIAGRTSTTPGPDDGFTLIEVLVAMGLFGIVSTLLLGLVLSTANVTDDTRAAANVTEESRIATERMARELRQAASVDAVQLSTLGSSTTALTFWTDFDGDGVRDLSAADPEVLTYRWYPDTRRLTLTANDADGTAVTRPVLAGLVRNFDLQLRSSLWQYDGTMGTADGVTTWDELDAAGSPVGNANGKPDGPELERIDLVSITLTVTDGGTERVFTMQADLRNREQN